MLKAAWSQWPRYSSALCQWSWVRVAARLSKSVARALQCRADLEQAEACPSAGVGHQDAVGGSWAAGAVQPQVAPDAGAGCQWEVLVGGSPHWPYHQGVAGVQAEWGVVGGQVLGVALLADPLAQPLVVAWGLRRGQPLSKQRASAEVLRQNYAWQVCP